MRRQELYRFTFSLIQIGRRGARVQGRDYLYHSFGEMILGRGSRERANDKGQMTNDQ
jgi:hypothetical protein